MDHLSSRLADEQRALFARLLAEEGLQAPERPAIPRRSRDGSLPLSFAQQRLWFLQRLGADEGAYNVPGVLDIKGALDVEALRRALATVVDRHEALRTSIVEQGGRPMQRIAPPSGLDVPLIDLQDRPLAERDEAAAAVATAQASAPFDLGRPPMIRAALVQLGPDEHRLLVTLHHIATDGWSSALFAREVSELYRAYRDEPRESDDIVATIAPTVAEAGRAPRGEGRDASARPRLPELPIQYADYAAWQRDWLTGDIERHQIDYWRQQLAGAAELELPMARLRPAVRDHAGAHVDFEIAEDLRASLARIGVEQGATFFMTALALFQLLLHRYSGQTDIVIGTPVAGRPHPDTEPLIGFFVNTLALRADLGGQPSFAQLVSRVREMALSAYAHQDVPLDRLVQELQPDRQGNKTPLFQVLMVVQDTQESPWNLPDLRTAWTDGISGREQFDLALELKVRPSGGLRGRFGFCTDIFDAETIARMAAHLVALLESACANPLAPIGDLNLLPEHERWQVVTGWNQTDAPHAADTLHGLFAAQAARTPAATAVLDERRALTYAQLDAQANQLAHYLAARGVASSTRVGICMSRSVDTLVALLGVLKTGAAYVPLDPAYPRDRVAFMLQDADARLVLTESSVRDRLPATDVQVVDVDRVRGEIAACPATPPELRASGNTPGHTLAAGSTHPAYVIYTSGSTGRPKGTVIRHASAVTLMHWARGLHDDDELSGMLASTSVCFDLSIYELFLPLSWGGTVIVVANVLDLQTTTHRARVRLINTVPSAIGELLRLKAVPAGVRTVNLAGEALTRAQVDQVYRGTQAERVINLYGPTEDTTYSTFAVLARDDASEVTIGAPIANTRAYVLNARLMPSPIGIPGDLYLSGDGLALGYLHRPDLTADRFVANPFGAAGARMYRTGDRAAWLADGTLRYLGRGDHQVKLRGYRIELGEIESALRAQASVRDAAVLVREDEPGHKRLVGYVTGRDDSALPLAETLRESLALSLPDYMVPAAIVCLEAMPLTPNGKLDRARLPAPSMARQDDAAYVPPATATQEVLAGIWADVLGRDRVGIRDHFFRAGGHSLLATQVIARVRDALQIDAPVRDLFDAPMLDDFARALTRREARPGQVERVATIFKQVCAMTAGPAAERA